MFTEIPKKCVNTIYHALQYTYILNSCDILPSAYKKIYMYMHIYRHLDIYGISSSENPSRRKFSFGKIMHLFSTGSCKSDDLPSVYIAVDAKWQGQGQCITHSRIQVLFFLSQILLVKLHSKRLSILTDGQSLITVIQNRLNSSCDTVNKVWKQSSLSIQSYLVCK